MFNKPNLVRRSRLSRRARLLLTAVVTLVLPLASLATVAPAQAALARPTGLSSSATATSPVLKWHAVSRATSYRVEVSNTSGFDSVQFSVTTTNVQATPTAVLPLGTLYWRVRAVSSGGTSGWARASFTRTMRDGPVLVAPVTESTLEQPQTPPVLRWNPVPGARSYEIELDGVEHDWVDTTTYKTETTSFVVHEPQPNGTYWWRVRAVLGTGVNTKYSDEWTYSIGALQSVVLPTYDKPMQDVVLKWDPVPGAVAYEIRISTDNGFNTITDQRIVAGTQYSPPTTYNNASYWWQVRAKNALGQAEEWPTYPDRTGVFTRTWPDQPALLYPADGSAPSGDFYYQWSPVPHASSYLLDVGTDPGFSSTNFFRTCATTQTTYTAGMGTTLGNSDACMPKKSGTYYWRVQAIDGPKNVNGIFSTVQSFTFTAPAAPTSTTGTLPEATGQRLSLNGDGASACTASLATGSVCEGVTSTPMLDWDPVPGAAYYRIYLSHDPQFTNMVSGYGDSGSPNTLPATINTRWSPVKALPDTQAGEAYYWFIRPCKTDNTCGLTPAGASNAFRKKSVPVHLESPSTGATVADQVTFNWTDYLDTADLATGEHPKQEARQYRIQVSDTQSFAKLIDDRTVDQTTYTAYDRSYPEGTMWWRVQAIDGSGNALTWSAPVSFTKASPVPNVIAPTDGEAVSSVQPFRWEALDYAHYYDLEVYRNNDTTASSVNKALWATNIRQTAFTADKPLDALGQDFVWRLRRSDYSGNKSAWGPWHRFRVTAVAPRLVSPGSGAKMSGKRPLFSWGSTPEATSYVWELRKGTTVTKRVSTVSTNYAPTWVVAKGKWTWRVTALNANGKVLKSAGWRSFYAS